MVAYMGKENEQLEYIQTCGKAKVKWSGVLL